MPRPNAGRRRRIVSEETMQTVSYTFHRATVEAMRELSQEGAIPNQSAFVEDAVRSRLRQIWWDAREAEYARAAADPEFMREMQETADAFRHADADALRALAEEEE